MLHRVTYFLFKLKLIQPSEKTISFWMINEQVGELEYTLKHGNYKTRKLAAEALGVLKKQSSIPALLQVVNDKVKTVSIAA